MVCAFQKHAGQDQSKERNKVGTENLLDIRYGLIQGPDIHSNIRSITSMELCELDILQAQLIRLAAGQVEKSCSLFTLALAKDGGLTFFFLYLVKTSNGPDIWYLLYSVLPAGYQIRQKSGNSDIYEMLYLISCLDPSPDIPDI